MIQALSTAASVSRAGPEPPRARREKRLLEPQVFDAETACWQPGIIATQSVPSMGLRVVTWNIWFGEHRWIERLDALMDTVGFFLPDLVGLQEVTPHQLDRLLASQWLREGFSISDASGETLWPHGVLLLSRMPIRSLELIPLPSRRDRKLLIAEVQSPCGALTVAVTHLESGRRRARVRQAQLRVIGDALAGRGPTILMGDFNFDADRDVERACLRPGLIDCWRAVHGDIPGNTIDSSENRMRGALGKVSGSKRCDCMLLRPDVGAWRPEQIWRLGLEPIQSVESGLYPSDHFGLAAVFEQASAG